jgi:hypothetical protein
MSGSTDVSCRSARVIVRLVVAEGDEWIDRKPSRAANVGRTLATKALAMGTTWLRLDAPE